MEKFEVRVMHQLGFFSFYVIEAANSHDASKKAKKQFVIDFCGGQTTYELKTYVFDQIIKGR